MAKTIPLRNELDPKYFWRVEDLYETKQAWLDAFGQLKAACETLSNDQGKLEEKAEEAIRLYFSAVEMVSKLYTYAHMQKDTDGGNNDHRATFDMIASQWVAFQSAASFLRPELIAMDEAKLDALLNDPDMADYTRYLEGLKREKPHTLSAQEERILAMTGEMANAPDEIYSAFVDVDMSFPDVLNEQGETVPFSEATYSPLIHSKNRAVREEAFKTMFETYAKFGTTLGSTYAASVKKDWFYAQLRHFPTCVEAELFGNEIPLSVYDNLVSTIHESLPILNDYLAVRKNALKLDELHMYDLYCPIIDSFDMDMPYDQAYETVVKGLQPMGEEYVSHLKEAYENGWIDVFPNKGKRSGAYSTSAYGVHPYVLLNHNDNLDGAMTIAHEMGHAMHSFCSNAAQSFAKADYCIFVAEVASTCNEIIVMKHLMEVYKDNKAALAFLCNHLLEQFRTTVFRQTMFAEFERVSHQMVEAGQPLTRDALSKAYYELNLLYYGGVCNVDELIADEWLRIPHFYRAFYVYQYATGFSAAVYLANRILTEGEAAVKDYFKFLSAGSSVPPIEALKLAGVDMAKPEPVLSAMQVFKDTLEQFKALI